MRLMKTPPPIHLCIGGDDIQCSDLEVEFAALCELADASAKTD